MSDFKIIDKDKTAVWVLNQGEFRVPDYARHAENPGTDLVIIEPGTPTKINFTESLRANTVLVEIEDPTSGDIVVKTKLPAQMPDTGKAPVNTDKPGANAR